MERNGLVDRSRERKIGLWIGGVSLFFLVSFFLVPFYLPTDSVPELSGRANTFDYYSEDSWGNVQTSDSGEVGHNQSEYGLFAWSELDPYAAFIYGFGDLNCHNKAERSWEINGNQMPVCVRDVGIFLGLAIGGFLFSRRGLNRWTLRDSFLSMFPDNKMEETYRNNRRTLALIVIAGIAIIPMGIDGFTQMLSSYESNPTMRLITGMPFGIFIGSFLASSFAARPEYFGRDPSNVVLPSGSRFSLAKDSEE
ncbi:MAG: DUF2085 domain-containing protein [Candidatus Poseidoniales archaeon]|nr:DUF2085 domain-containing protein [Candidatus Poseidoniales archaeon]